MSNEREREGQDRHTGRAHDPLETLVWMVLGAACLAFWAGVAGLLY